MIGMAKRIVRRVLKRALRKVPGYRYFEDYWKTYRYQVLSEDEKRCVKFYQQFVREGDLVFDVGANMGTRTKVFLKLGARVVAFEPQKACSDYLKTVLKEEDGFTLVEAALGEEDGEAEMLISNAHTISTLSEDWVKATRESSRFNQYEWNRKQAVRVTTLDNVIKKYGTPSFIKIDVEGYENEVLKGLSTPIQCISIEFAAEVIENTYKCIEHLSSLSTVSFQYSEGESMEFSLPTWVSKKEMENILEEVAEKNKLAWGDVYIVKKG